MLALVTHEDSPKDGMTRNDGIDGNLDGNPYASVSSVQIDGKLQRELYASGCRHAVPCCTRADEMMALMATLMGSHTRADGERMVRWERESLREQMQARPTRVDAMMASMVTSLERM